MIRYELNDAKIEAEVKICAIEVSARNLAEMFCKMHCVDQARVFNEIANITDEWDGTFAMQLQFIIDSGILTEKGVGIMKAIGEYAEDV